MITPLSPIPPGIPKDNRTTAPKRSCYECAHAPICSMRREMDNGVVRSHLDFLNVDAPASSPESFIHLFTALAAACKRFKEAGQ